MRMKLMYTVFILFIKLTITNLQLQSVVAIVAASIPEDSDDPKEAVVYLTYSKWAANSGAKVIPILPWYSREKIDQILDKVNGVIWQGGMRNLRIGGQFESMNKYIFDKIIQKNDKQIHFPMFLICQGFELVHILMANSTNILSNYNAMKYFIPMEINNNTNTSKIYSKFTEKDFQTFTELNSTVHYHKYGFETELYNKYKIFNDFFTINSFGYDRNGKKFIGSVEGKKYPIYAVQYHPEKVRYERNIPSNNTVNSNEAFVMSKKLADFFIEETRKNKQKISDSELNEYLMIKVFTEEPVHYHSAWVYLFKKKPKNLKR
jgi:gamma-glutamyl hydrolase